MSERLTRRSFILGCLLFASLLVVPTAAADSGGGLMVIESIAVDGDGGVGTGDITVTLDVIEVDAGGANMTLHSEVISAAGDPIASTNLSISLNASERKQVSFTLTAVPPGQHQLRMTLLGDVAVPASVGLENGSDVDERFITRLLPLSLALQNGPDWTITPIDASTGIASTNSTLRQGDEVMVDIDVDNLGQVAWTGSWVIEEGDGVGNWSSLDSGEVEVLWDSDAIIHTSFGPVEEGLIELRTRLIGLQDADTSDNSQTVTLTVEPPAMARPSISVNANTTGAMIGDELNANVSISNNGEQPYSSTWSCIWLDGVEIDSAAGMFDLAVGQSEQNNFTFIARPGVMSCSIIDIGVHADSIMWANLTVEMSSASFTIAGSAGLALSGLPAYIGDTVVAGVLVHNSGDVAGEAMLTLNDSAGTTSDGIAVRIEAGSSREVTASMIILANGSHIVNWTVTSLNGIWDSTLSDSLEFESAESQTLDVTMSVDDWTLADGLSVTVTTDLSAGRDRPITIRLSQTGVAGSPLISFDAMLPPGVRTLSFDLGQPASGAISLVVQTPGWTADGFTSADVVAQIPEVDLSIQHLTWGLGEDPIPGGRTTLTFDLVNDGASRSLPGTIRIVDTSDGRILKSFSVEAVGSDSERIGAVIEPWPMGSAVNLRIDWLTAAGDAELQETISNGVDPEQAAGGLPTEALGIGAIVGLAIGLAARLVMNREQRSEEIADSKSVKKASRVKEIAIEEIDPDGKREVSCPSCEQALRVPATYTGRARCPACSTEFKAELSSSQTDSKASDTDTDVNADAKTKAESDEVVVEASDIVSGRDTVLSDSIDSLPPPVTSNEADIEDGGVGAVGSRVRGSQGSGAAKSGQVELNVGVIQREKSSAKSKRESKRAAKKVAKKAPGRKSKAVKSKKGAKNLISKSSDDLLSCPSCRQKLRVPLNKRPTRARCPACRSEFRAEADNV
jgi:uncharacterized CHY-type Zn-finger protein